MEKATRESLRCYKHAGRQLSQRQSFSQSWGSNPLATWCKELTHWKRPWCWERLKAGEGDDRGWDGGWHHRLDGHEFEQAPEVGDRQGRLACCSPWGHKGSDVTERLNWLSWVTCEGKKFLFNPCFFFWYGKSKTLLSGPVFLLLLIP